MIYTYQIYYDCYKDNTTSEEAILDYCSISRSRTELIEFTGKSRTYTMISLIVPLVNAGKLKMTLPVSLKVLSRGI